MSLLEKYYLTDLGILEFKSSPVEKKLVEDLKILFIMNLLLEDMMFI